MIKALKAVIQTIFTFLLLTIIPFKLNAQQQEQKLITQTIETYFDGWMTSDILKIGTVMNSKATSIAVTCKILNRQLQ